MLYRNQTTVHDAARSFAALTMTINPVAMCVPLNLSDLEADWKACAKHGHFFNPEFIYDRTELQRIALLSVDLYSYWSQIDLGCLPENELDRAILAILKHRFTDAILATEIAASILNADDVSTQAAIYALYGEPSGSLIMHAYDALAHPSNYREQRRSRFSSADLSKLESLSFNAEDIRRKFQIALSYYGFHEAWECVIDQRVTHAIDARDKTTNGKSQLVIPARKTVNGRALASLIGHEIESHIRSSENARALFRKLLSRTSLMPLMPLVPLLAKSDNECFYEGVAKLSDVTTNGDHSLPHPFYAIAIHNAQSGKNFGEIAQIIAMLRHTGNVSQDEAINFAWNVTRRIYRGCTDTSKSFANTKDYSYFAGYILAKSAPASYRDYSSMTVDDLQLLEAAGIGLTRPNYPYEDAVKYIFNL